MTDYRGILGGILSGVGQQPRMKLWWCYTKEDAAVYEQQYISTAIQKEHVQYIDFI